MIIGGIFTIAAVCYSTVRAAGSDAIVGKQENDGLLEKTESGRMPSLVITTSVFSPY